MGAGFTPPPSKQSNSGKGKTLSRSLPQLLETTVNINYNINYVIFLFSPLVGKEG